MVVWPVFDRATTPAERARAVEAFLERAGVAGKVPGWRARAMLGPWFEAGWCVAGLLFAVDHHPDRPDAGRGDALRAARDPLRVLGYRLTPWRGRGAEVPPALRAVDGAERRRRAERLAGLDEAGSGVRAIRGQCSTPAVRASARAEVARVLARRAR